MTYNDTAPGASRPVIADVAELDDLLDVGCSVRISDSELVLVTARLLSLFPTAGVVAIGDNGLFQPMPNAVPLQSQRVIEGHASALELVIQSDIMIVIEGWKRARICGAARAVVHPLHQPEQDMVLYFVDARAEYGVLLGFAVHPAGALISADRGTDDLLRPRVSVVRKNDIAEFTELDHAFELLLGYDRTALLGRRNLELVHPDDQPRAIANWMDMLGSPGRSRRVRLRQQHCDGHWIWFEITNHNRLNAPDERCVVTEMIDISEEMAAQESLRASEQLLRSLTESLPVGVLQLDLDRNLVHCSARVQQILGGERSARFAELFRAVPASDLELLDKSLDSALLDGADADLEISATTPGGATVRCRVSVRTLVDDQGAPTGAIMCIDDVTERARLRAQLEVRATYDALTGCHNRASVLTALEVSLEQAAETGTGVAVVFLDLNGFKAVNDELGHSAGDARLRRISTCLRDALRHNDIVGRVGGDEFLVLSTEVGSAEQALALAERLAEALAHAVEPHPPARAVASLGVCWAAPGDADGGLTADLMVAQADAAMYESKRDGRGQPVLSYPH